LVALPSADNRWGLEFACRKSSLACDAAIGGVLPTGIRFWFIASVGASVARRPIRPMDAACRATALPPTTSASPLSAAQLALPTTALKDCESRIVGQPFVSFL